MIKEIEGLLLHWAEQYQGNTSGGLGSPMATIMQYGGAAPRGTPGSRDLLRSAGAGPDFMASEVDAAIGSLERQGAAGKQLALLARLRYVQGHTVREQIRLLGMPENAERRYHRLVNLLHHSLKEELALRAMHRRQMPSISVVRQSR